MLPFTTYNIPESFGRKMPSSSQWLWIITEQALSMDDEALLSKICTAIKATYPEDVYVLTSDGEVDISLSSLPQDQVRLIISFGITPSRLGLWIDLDVHGIRYLEPFAFILTSSLELLNASPSGKKQLWSSMLSFLDKK